MLALENELRINNEKLMFCPECGKDVEKSTGWHTTCIPRKRL